MRLYLLSGLMLLYFGFAQSASAISFTLDGYCQYGPCGYHPYEDVLPVGGSAKYNFDLVDTWKSTDQYRVHGTVLVRNIPGATVNGGATYLLTDFFTASYLGNSTNTATAPQELLRLDFGQNFENAVPPNRPGTAYETVSGKFSPGFLSAGFISGQPYVEIQETNFGTPTFRTPPLAYSGEVSEPVVNFFSEVPTGADMEIALYFSAGAIPGTSVSINNSLQTVLLPAPEPGTWAMLATALLGVVVIKHRSKVSARH